VRIGGGSGAHPALVTALSSARNRVARATRSPALGVAVITPLVLAAAVGASGPAPAPAPAEVANTDVTPMVAVAPTPLDTSGPTVVAVARPVTSFSVAAGSTSAPPPAAVVTAPGALRIPSIALSAYRNAEAMMTRALPACGVSWNLLAGIGRIESGHANGGATDTRGNPVKPIYGPALDGTLPGNEIIVQSVQAGRVTYARAMGPMQFLPGTWSRYASDGDGDGEADPQNIYDATLAAARYLCSGNMNLRDQDQVLTAILRYNNSMAYARNVLGWAAAYATGVAPVDLPPINGPIPAVSVAQHVNVFKGLGPDIPGTVQSLPATDPLARNPVLAQTDVANQLPVPPGPESLPGTPGSAPCQVFCLSEKRPPAPASTPAAPAPFAPPWMAPPPPAAPPAPAPFTPPWMAPAPPAPGLPAPGAPDPATPLGPAPGPAA